MIGSPDKAATGRAMAYLNYGGATGRTIEWVNTGVTTLGDFNPDNYNYASQSAYLSEIQIQAVSVPEPSSTAFFALNLMGLLAWRRRK